MKRSRSIRCLPRPIGRLTGTSNLAIDHHKDNQPMRQHAPLRNTCLALTACVALGVAGLTAPVPAWGQAAGMGGMGESHTVTERAQVKAIDLATREVTLVGPQGNVFGVHAGDAVRNLDKVKVGDTVVATFYSSTVLVLSAPGTKIPDNHVSAAAARAAKGEVPAAAVSTKAVVTGTVVGVDLNAHTISLVDPSGGLVHIFAVTDLRRQAALKRVKIGDSLTVIGTEAFAIALDPV
jgi:Cu/Ag efflux protein CusF